MYKIQNAGSNRRLLIAEKCTLLISYETPVAVRWHLTGTIECTNADYSQTTKRHIREFVRGEAAPATKIAQGDLEIILYRLTGDTRLEMPIKMPRLRRYSLR